MRAYVSPEFIFDRSPTGRDRVVRFGRDVVKILGLIPAALSNPDHRRIGKAEHRMYKADDELNSTGQEFTEHWNERLGQELIDGVRLRTTTPGYSISAVVTKEQWPELPDVIDQYKITTDTTVAQSGGHNTRFKVDTYTVHHRVGAGEELSVQSHSNVSPLLENGEINSDGWGWYTYKESAQLSEVATRVLSELDQDLRAGTLEISNVADEN